MNSVNPDQNLIDWVQRQINTGTRRIIVPGYLLMNASDTVIEEVRRLCKLNRVSVEIKV